jgi:predicted DCC family thiol-disulfide oxidoreductase YuxK
MQMLEEVEAGGPIVLYDGTCGLCTRSVQLILRNDPTGRFRFAPLQSELGQSLLARHGMGGQALDSVVLVDKGLAWERSRAALRIARGLRRPWPALGVLRLVPRPLADFVYDRVAHNRYRLFGRSDACMIPAPGMGARFLA